MFRFFKQQQTESDRLIDKRQKKGKFGMKREILLLGDPRLYRVSEPVQKEDCANLLLTVRDLHDTLFDYREKHHAGRAIAAPQIGCMKRLIYMHIEKPVILINPELEFIGEEMITVLDDCMSFPGLLVKVRRYKTAKITFRDPDWEQHTMDLSGDLSELLQHEYDHLDGILATMRAIDNRSFYIKKPEA